MKKILITGGAGFIGSHLVNMLSKKNKVVVIDKLLHGNKIFNMNSNIKLVKADIRNYKLVKKYSKNCACIFHLASVLGVDIVSKNHLETMDTEFIGTSNVCRAARANNVKKIVYTSTSGVYGKKHFNISPKEIENVAPVSSYAMAKRNSELYLKYFNKKFKINCIAVRLFNVYGPGRAGRMVIPRIYRWAKKNKNIILYNDGRQTRDFTYIDDCIKAFVLIYKKLKGYHILNVAKGQDTKIIDLAKLIKGMTKSKSKIIFKKIPENLQEFEVRKRRGNSYTLYKKTKYKPTTSLKSGLKATFRKIQLSL